jgi:hypothetical protein
MRPARRVLAAVLALAALGAPAGAGGTFVYVDDGGAGALHAFKLNLKAGTLEPLPDSPVAGLEGGAGLDGWAATLDWGRLKQKKYLFSGGATGVTIWSLAKQGGAPTPEIVTSGLLPPGTPCAGTATRRIHGRLYFYAAQVDDAHVQGYRFKTKNGPSFGTDTFMGSSVDPQPIGLDVARNHLVVASASGTLSSFRLAKDGDLLAAQANPFPIQAEAIATCQLDRQAKRVYVADGDAQVHVLEIAGKNGKLETVADSPFDTGLGGGGAGLDVLKKPFVLAYDFAAAPGEPLVSVLKRGNNGKLVPVGQPQPVAGMTSVDAHAVTENGRWLVLASDTDDAITLLRLDLKHGTATVTDSLPADFDAIHGMTIVKL